MKRRSQRRGMIIPWNIPHGQKQQSRSMAYLADITLIADASGLGEIEWRGRRRSRYILGEPWAECSHVLSTAAVASV